MAIKADIKISLQEFDGSAGCDFLKIHPSLAASQPLPSHATDMQKRLHGWAKFPLHLLQPSTTIHVTILYSSPFLSLPTGQQACCIKASIINQK
jgi:hypothetical protein